MQLIKFNAIVVETFREAKAKKTLVGFFIVSSILLLIALLIFQLDVVQKGLLSKPEHATKNGQPLPIGMVLDFVWIGVASMLLFMTVLVGIFATAGFITSLMEKGTIDLYLSKPVSRWMYIFARFIGAELILIAEAAYLVVGLWLIAGISLGVWNGAFLASIFFIAICFAGMYSIAVLISVLTRSSLFAIIMSTVIFFVSGILIPAGQWIDKLLNGTESTGVFSVVTTIIHHILPRTSEITTAMQHSLTGQAMDFGPLAITIGLTALYLGLAMFAFSKKEF